MALTAVAIKALKPKDRAYLAADGESLYLHVTPSGGKSWRFRYRFDGRQDQLSIGPFPRVSVADARAARNEAKRLLDQGINPREEKKARKAQYRAEAEEVTDESPTFGDVALEFMALKRRDGYAPATMSKMEWIFEELGDVIRSTPITEITRRQLLDRMQVFEKVSHLDKVQRMRTFCSRVFSYAINAELVDMNPTPSASSVASPKSKKHAAIFNPELLGQFLRDIDTYSGIPSVCFMLRLSPYVCLRSHEIRDLVWDDVDWKNDYIRIPGVRMRKSYEKGDEDAARDHIIPMATQVRALLEEMLPFSGPGADRTGANRIFPGQRKGRPISENTANVAYKTMGYTHDVMVFHGLRRTATTLLNEAGWNKDWIELQMAHVDGNSVRRIYNAAQYLEGRREMMQAWADMLDQFRAGE